MGLTGWGLAAIVGLCVGCSPPANDADAVRAALIGFSRDFNNEDLAATCDLFAEDVEIDFQGRPPARGRSELCERMQRIFADPTKSFRYAEPSIREVLVDGRLAAVSLVWTLTVYDERGQVIETTREDGVDVFRREPDGRWRIQISHAFPVQER